MEDGGKACGDISHCLCPEEDIAVPGSGCIYEEELEFNNDGYIIFNGVIDKSFREPGYCPKLHVGISMSEEDTELVGERDVFELSIMGKEMELFTILVVFDPDRVLGGMSCATARSRRRQGTRRASGSGWGPRVSPMGLLSWEGCTHSGFQASM